MKFFAARFDHVVMRFYLTMLVAVGSWMIGLPWLSLLCLPVFLSAMLAVKFDLGKSKQTAKMNPTIKRTTSASQAA